MIVERQSLRSSRLAARRLAAIAAVSLALALAGCGRRGALEVPDGAAAKPAGETVYSPTRPQEKSRTVVPSSEPFVLDPLL